MCTRTNTNVYLHTAESAEGKLASFACMLSMSFLSMARISSGSKVSMLVHIRNCTHLIYEFNHKIYCSDRMHPNIRKIIYVYSEQSAVVYSIWIHKRLYRISDILKNECSAGITAATLKSVSRHRIHVPSSGGAEGTCHASHKQWKASKEKEEANFLETSLGIRYIEKNTHKTGLCHFSLFSRSMMAFGTFSLSASHRRGTRNRQTVCHLK